MANVTQFRPSGKGTSHSALSDWDVVSEDALSQGRYSSGSLSSDESDAVIIFGGKTNSHASLRETASALTPNSVMSNTGSVSSNAYGFISESDDDETEVTEEGSGVERWQQKHQRLLSAVSDLASDPGLKTVAQEIYGGLRQSMPIEQRLLDQIAKLAEELDDYQEKSRVLRLQNEILTSENAALKTNLTEKKKTDCEDAEKSLDDQEPGVMRVALAVAAGLLVIGLAKKRLLFNDAGVLGVAVVGGCAGLVNYLNAGNTGKRSK
mmetsp:Transcript_4327/g.6418  ORF Transcript_4327/g.6418 Transcript_4327/m.6418 type:complete len:265 (-) Transcript_4327:1877-2671(-)